MKLKFSRVVLLTHKNKQFWSLSAILRQGFSHYTDRDIRSNVLFAPNQWGWVTHIQVIYYNIQKRIWSPKFQDYLAFGILKFISRINDWLWWFKPGNSIDFGYFNIWASLWENQLFAYAKTKTQISFAVTAKLISAFVFAIRKVQSLYYLNPKFQASSHLLWLYSLVCVGPGQKPRTPVFSQRGSFMSSLNFMLNWVEHEESFTTSGSCIWIEEKLQSHQW